MKRTLFLLLMLLLAAALTACGKAKEADVTAAADNALSGSGQLSISDAAYLEYDNGQVTCRFRRDEDGWKWVDNEKFPLDAADLEQTLTMLDAMSASLTPLTAAVDPTVSGLDEPERYLTVTVGEETETLRFGKQTEDGQWYMSVDGGDGVYLAADELMQMMNRSVYDMAVLPTLPELTDDNLTVISVRDAEGRSARLTKTEEGWVSENRLVPDRAQAVEEALAAFRFDRCFDFDPAPEAAPLCGLDAPTVITAAYINSVGTETTLTLTLGTLREDGAYYVTLNEDTSMYLVSQDKVAAFLALL